MLANKSKLPGEPERALRSDKLRARTIADGIMLVFWTFILRERLRSLTDQKHGQGSVWQLLHWLCRCECFATGHLALPDIAKVRRLAVAYTSLRIQQHHSRTLPRHFPCTETGVPAFALRTAGPLNGEFQTTSAYTGRGSLSRGCQGKLWRVARPSRSSRHRTDQDRASEAVELATRAPSAIGHPRW